MENTEIKIGLKNPLEVITKGNGIILLYYTEDIEQITRKHFKEISELIQNENITLHTNCGVDLHSSEDSLYNIKVKKFSYMDYALVKDDLMD